MFVKSLVNHSLDRTSRKGVSCLQVSKTGILQPMTTRNHPLPRLLLALPAPRRTSHHLARINLPRLAPSRILVVHDAEHNVLVVVAGCGYTLFNSPQASACFLPFSYLSERVMWGCILRSSLQHTRSTSLYSRVYTLLRLFAAAARSSLCFYSRVIRCRAYCALAGSAG